MYSSNLENGIFEEFMRTQGVSAVKLLQVANDAGIQVFFINQTNITTILPQLSLPAADIQDLQNAVNAGKVVYAPQHTMNYGAFTGIGYMVLDPDSGAGAYMISGDLGTLNGGSAPPDGNFDIKLVLNFVKDVLMQISPLIKPALGKIANCISAIDDILTGISNGTATAADYAWTIAVDAACWAASEWLTTPNNYRSITLATALLAGVYVGPGATYIAAVVAVLIIVAVGIIIYFQAKLIVDKLMSGWLQNINAMIALRFKPRLQI
jgi:hypothetical protein